MINVRLVQEPPISARIKPEHGIKVLDHTVYLYDPSVVDDQVDLAKDWAIKMDGKVVEEWEEVDYSSKYYASEAKTSETNAASSASSASTSANLASGYANSASSSAGTATTKASEAAASASSAATSASNASTSATNASNSASIAVAAATDPNVVAVGTNIQNINKVANNETNINTVVGMNEDISTVANISNYVADVGAISADVSTVASITSDVSTVSSHAADVVNVSENMSSVVSAVDYAAEAKVWAEGTDSEVEDYGGEKSSKGWAARAKEIVDSIGSVLHYKGSVATRDDLPALGQVLGDMYNILSDGSNVVWTGTGWDEISGVVDLSEYRKAADQDTIDAGKVPTSRTINDKALTEDITLTPADVGAATAAQGAKADTAVQPATLNNYVTLNTLQTLTSGKKVFANDAVMAGNQTALLATISNSNTYTTDNAWVGRYICGAKNLTFLMGTYRTMAGIGAHSWTNAQSGSGASWADFYLNPDGDKTVFIGGNLWTKNAGWFKVKNNGNSGGLVQVNKGTITSPSWKDVAYKSENVSDFTNDAGYITAASIPTTYVHEQGVASAVWTVQHNLNKYPSVTVVDSSENVIIADVEYVDVNTVKITMNGASKGRAYLN